MRKSKRFFGGRLFPCILLALLSALFVCAAAVWLPRALAPLAIAERLFSFAVALFLATTEPRECAVSKLVLLLLLPWAGAALCIIWRRRPAPPFAPFRSGGSLLEKIAAIGGAEVCYADSAEYFPVGSAMKERLLADLANAEASIWLEYYIVEQGSFFGAVLSVLREKAAAGLDVRLAYDDFGCALTLPRNFSEDLRRSGIRVTVLRPVKFPLRSLNRRNHRKIAVIDGKIGYVGGINLADEYTGEKIRFGHWKDTALRVTGEPAQKLAGLFAGDAGIPPPDFPPAERGTLPCAIVSDPADGETLRAGLCAHTLLLARAEKYAYFFTPYLAPDSALLHAFRCAAAAGADIRILIPHIPDKKATFLLTRRFARELERAGVQVREYTAGFLHAKCVVTEEYAFVSSYNLDYRSLYLQAECGIAIKDGELVRKLTEDFLSAWESGSPVKRARLPERVLTAIVSPFLPLV